MLPVSTLVRYPTPPAFFSDFGLGKSANGRGELTSFSSPPARMDEAEFKDWRLVFNHGHRALPLEIGGTNGSIVTILLRPDETIIMAPNTRTTWKWSALAQCDILQIPTSFLEATSREAFGTAFVPRASLSHLGVSKAGDALCMLRESLDRDRHGGQLVAECFTMIALTRVARRYDDSLLGHWNVRSDEDGKMLPSDIGFAGLVAHLRANPCKRLSIAEMEHVSGLRRATLGRRFKSEHNVSPTGFARRLMSDEACRRLKNKAGELSQIALDCGFSDQAHMSRVLKDMTGLTPTQIR